MATAQACPEPRVQVAYSAWLRDVRTALESMEDDMAGWQANWRYDFHADYEAGRAPSEAAIRAHDFWWQQVLVESWT